MELLTVKDAAERIGVTPKAIYYSLKEGKLKARKQYGRLLIAIDDLASYQPRASGKTGRGMSAALSRDTQSMTAESTRHIWDTPEEDEAWAYLQEAT